MNADGGGGLWRALKVPEFRALWAATAIGRAGAQIGRVALAVLAYQRTGSASVTALVYALTLVPALVGGPLLGGLADRYPRRRLIVVCGLARALLVAPAAVPAIPLPVLAVLILVSQLLESPAVAAQIAVTPDVLPPPVYRAGVAIQQLTAQLVALIDETLASMPHASDSGIEVFLASDDYERIRDLDPVRAKHWKLVVDPRLESGECRIRAGSHEADAGCRQRLAACMEQIAVQLQPPTPDQEAAR